MTKASKHVAAASSVMAKPPKPFGPTPHDFGVVPSPKAQKKLSWARGVVDLKGKGKAKVEDGEGEGEEGKEGKEGREKKGKRKMVDMSERAMMLQQSPQTGRGALVLASERSRQDGKLMIIDCAGPQDDLRPTRRSRPLSAFARPDLLAQAPLSAPPAEVEAERGDGPSKKKARAMVRLSDPGSTAAALLEQASRTPDRRQPPISVKQESNLKPLAPPPPPEVLVAGPSMANGKAAGEGDISTLAPALLSAIVKISPPQAVPEGSKLLPLAPPPLTLAIPVPSSPRPFPQPQGPGLSTPSFLPPSTSTLEDLLSPRKKRPRGERTMPYGLAERAEAVIERGKSEWGMWRSDVSRPLRAEVDDDVVLVVEEVLWKGGNGKACIARCRVVDLDFDATQPGDPTAGLVFFSLHLSPSSSSSASTRNPPPGERRPVTVPLELVRLVKGGTRVWGERPWSVVEMDGQRALVLTRFGVL